MNKYTILNAFEKKFPFPIWKIEVDCSNNLIAVEYRDPESTLPHFTVVDFEGITLSAPLTVTEKEWTLESIQGEFIILKRFGSSSPIEAGIQILHHPTATCTFMAMEYILHEVYNGKVEAKHRSISSGLSFLIDIPSGEITTQQPSELHYPYININYPVPYSGKLPVFLQQLNFLDNLWLLPYKDIFIGAYHQKEGNTYNLHLFLSTKNEVIDNKIILKNLDKLIPQPFFQVEGHIFFLSNTKQEFVAYLV